MRKACRDVKHTILVDDFGQHVVGTLHEVSFNMAMAAVRFVQVARALKLIVSAIKPVAIFWHHTLLSNKRLLHACAGLQCVVCWLTRTYILQCNSLSVKLVALTF